MLTVWLMGDFLSRQELIRAPTPRTAISMWFANGMSERGMMVLARHASFGTTHEFYVAVADDLADRARAATEQGLRQKLAHFGADAF